MARKPINGTRLKTWDEVNSALREIGVIDQFLAEVEASKLAAIELAGKTADSLAGLPMLQKAGLEHAIREFAQVHRADFGDSKTKNLRYGYVNYRISPGRVVVANTEKAIEYLEQMELGQCIRVMKKLDKEALKSLPVETLYDAGITIKTDETFGYEVLEMEGQA